MKKPKRPDRHQIAVRDDVGRYTQRTAPPPQKLDAAEEDLIRRGQLTPSPHDRQAAIRRRKKK
jgi:hypothetical protein